MKKKNLYCLVDRDNQHVTLDLVRYNSVPVNGFAIDLDDNKWRSGSSDWQKIGETGKGQVRLVFDAGNFEQLKNALDVAQNFQR